MQMPINPTPDDVRWAGEQLRNGYRSKGWSRRKAAEHAGLSDRTWGRTEKGAREDGTPSIPDDSSIVWMARAVDIDPKPLLRRLGYDEALADLLPPRRQLAERVESLETKMVLLDTRISSVMEHLGLLNTPGSDPPSG